MILFSLFASIDEGSADLHKLSHFAYLAAHLCKMLASCAPLQFLLKAKVMQSTLYLIENLFSHQRLFCSQDLPNHHPGMHAVLIHLQVQGLLLLRVEHLETSSGCKLKN